MARVSMVTGKSQLRGRVRREVMTLLEEGHEVLIIGLASKEDFLQGLDHPNLKPVLLQPDSVYNRGMRLARLTLGFRRRDT